MRLNQFQDRTKNRHYKIGVVTSRFNPEVTEKLEAGAVQTLKSEGFSDQQILQVQVPGAVEIPLAAKWLLESGCDAVVTLGAVIRGETSHYDYVCSSVERGCTLLMQETGKPVGFGVLTTESDEQAMDRAGGRHGNKGAEAAEVVLQMLAIRENIFNQ